jgi:hypothetical protein
MITLIVLAFAGALVHAPSASGAANGGAGIAIPLYTYPTDGTWAAVIRAKVAYPNVPFVAVINPGSGPGASSDPNYATGIKNLQAAGVQVLGYVYTSYGARSTASAEADISSYNNWYHVNGVFLDQMNNVPGYEAYYSTLSGYASSIGMSTTFGNPGTSVPTSYIGTVSTMCVSENHALPPLSFISYPGYSPSNFYVMAYGVALDASYISQAAKSASWFYLTDAPGPNPYNVLPSYFLSEVATLSAIDAAAASTTTTTTTTTTTSSTTRVLQASVSVNSVDLSGNPLSGMWTTFVQNGATLGTGFTPVAFSGTTGNNYVVAVGNYQNYVFCHWQDGNSNSARTVTLGGNTALTAYFSTNGSCVTQFQVTIRSSSITGVQFTGMWLSVTSNGKPIASGFTALTFTATAGVSYQVTMSNYQNFVFQYWNSGSGNPSLTITPTQATTLTAYYGTGGLF